MGAVNIDNAGSGGAITLSSDGTSLLVGGTAVRTGTVPIANGGTGQTTANAALNALLPNQSGNSGKFLTTNGTDASWATAGGGGGGSSAGSNIYLANYFGGF